MLKALATGGWPAWRTVIRGTATLGTATLCTAALCTALATAARAAGYPDKPITVIIGFAPGGPTDVLGRVIFKKIAQDLHVAAVIENKPGAGGNLAAQLLTTAKPDGYTLLFASAAISIAPALYDRKDLDPKTTFAAVGCSSAVPLILLVSKRLKVNNAEDFYRLVKANPGKYFTGNSGNGTMDQLVAADIGNKLGLTFESVPYKGNEPALTGLVAGDTSFMYSGSFNSAIPFIKNGDVKALGVSSGQRSKALPDVPALKETVAGLKNYDAGTWQAILAPKGTPAPVLEKINKALNDALKDPEVLASLRFQGAEVMNTTPAQCQTFIDSETDRWSKLIKKLGLHS